MKIAIVVHGRFHAFDLARELLHRGHEVTLFTNYPKWAVEPFGVPGKHVRSFWIHGGLSRVSWWLRQMARCSYPEAALHILFGRWAAREIEKEQWDVVHCWSGISEEILVALAGRNTLKLLMRGSTHIRTQARILEEEEKRTRTALDHPSSWIIAREEREYALADRITVLSSFSYRTFIEEKVPSQKLCILPLGAQIERFRPTPEIIESRCRRILSGRPLQVLYVGALSFRKGMWDMASILREADRNRFQFRLVGPAAAETKKLLTELRGLGEFIPKQPQHELPNWYAGGDLFIFPTLEEGYPMVLSQASASALPVLTTPNGAGVDLVQEGETGWVLPIRSPGAFMERLIWCDKHRRELAEMARRIYGEYRPRDWSNVAADFERICRS
ncbi:MAG: glycosyltransferase family 4 protein [Candidatus Omnitrophica bacterium]|nr:glycosyltransferase family 4 protein [Candidatus Omnitrophota bacterium]